MIGLTTNTGVPVSSYRGDDISSDVCGSSPSANLDWRSTKFASSNRSTEVGRRLIFVTGLSFCPKITFL